MKSDEVFVADMVTDGKFSRLLEENKSKDGTIETLVAEKEALSAESEALSAESEDLRRTINVLALLAENKSVGEISEILEISPSEVAQILERVDREKKRLS
jgi:predicted HTH domain antitoxin